MNRAESIWGWASRDRVAWWGGGAALAVVFFSVAWADVRLLLALPVVAGALYLLYVRRREEVAEREREFEDWF
jgi:Flp pilus assembly protein TadB